MNIQTVEGVEPNTALIVTDSPDHDRLVVSAGGVHRAVCRKCSWQSEPFSGMLGELHATVAANVHGMTAVKITVSP